MNFGRPVGNQAVPHALRAAQAFQRQRTAPGRRSSLIGSPTGRPLHRQLGIHHSQRAQAHMGHHQAILGSTPQSHCLEQGAGHKTIAQARQQAKAKEGSEKPAATPIKLI